MASISGATSKMGFKIGSTWGTAVACGSGNQLIAECSWQGNGQELVPRSIGSGKAFDYTSTLGNIAPTVSLTGEFGFNNTWPVVFAALFGTSAAPTEQNVGEGDYLHQLLFSTSHSTLKPATLAYEDTTTTTAEFTSALVRSVGLKTTSVPGYLEATAELLASQFKPDSSTNTNATLANVTLSDPDLAIAKFESEFEIDDASGSLASGDLYAITGFDFQLQRAMEMIPEIKGSPGNSFPVASGNSTGTFNATVKELANHTYYAAWLAETVKMAMLEVLGNPIGAGENKRVSLFLPHIKLVQEPQYALSGPGVNALSLNFKILEASAAPTGMDSVRPYLEIVNGRATSLLA